MRLAQTKLLCVVLCVIVGEVAVHSQGAADPLQQLVETSAQRLMIAKQVALSKWDSGAPVEDAEREAQVIASASKAGETMGLDRKDVSDFFRAQIEANKQVQDSLLAEWHRAGKAPEHKPVNLKGTIRPELDSLETQLLEELVKTKELRAGSACNTEVAKKVGIYMSAHKERVTQVEAIALDRAMAQTCERPTR
jgi:chorismate mutase